MQLLRGFVLTLALLALALAAWFVLDKLGEEPLTRALLGRALAMSGMLMTLLAQVLAFAVLLRHNAMDALFSLLVPAYALVALRRAGHHAWLFGVYLASIASLAAGTFLLA